MKNHSLGGDSFRITPLNFKKLVMLFVLPLIATTMALAQQKLTVNGTVTDKADGTTLPTVTVMVKGSTIGVTSDADGIFSINVPDGENGVLEFTYMGYKTIEVPINGKKVLNVTMEVDAEVLGEVMVIGYGVQRKGSVIGSVDRVSPDKLRQPSRTLSTSLAGRLAGVVAVQASGEPGYDGATFWIRGINTFAGGATPLILVDGVERNLDNVDSDEIADFTILKDATATAVYGVRGANGVVLVTTKKGTASKPKVNFRFENSFSAPVSMPDFVDGPTFMRMQNEALYNVNPDNPPLFTEDYIRNTELQTDPYFYPDVNWLDALLKDWSTTQHATLNVSGGTELVRYFVSGAFLNQNGMFKNFGGTSYNNNINLKRYNFRTNVDMNVTKTTILNVQIAAILEDRNYPGEGTSGIFGWMKDLPPTMYPVQYPDKTKVPGEAYNQTRSPFQMLARSGYATENHTTVQSNISLNQNLSMITEGLNARVLFSFDAYTRASNKNVMKPRPYLIRPYGYDDNGNPELIDGEGKYNYIDQAPADNSYHDYLKKETPSVATDRKVYVEASLNYNRTFLEKHNVGAMLLYNQDDKTNPMEGDIYNSVSTRHQGLTGRVNYAYDDKYFAEFNFGYNGSENFAKGQRYGFFPSAAIGWIPTKESFMEFMKPAISYMKIKLSHGQVGNDALASILANKDNYYVSRFFYLTRVANTSTNYGFGLSDGYGYGSGAGIDIIYYGNPDATWETATKTDLGIEVNFLDGFHLQADFFYEKRTNIWTQLSKVPDMLGFGNAKPGANVGEMENKGIDGYLEYTKQINKDWMINVKGTFSFARNKVLANGAEVPRYAYQSQIGQPVNRSLGYISEGYFIDQAEIDGRPKQTFGGVVKPGDIKYKDVNGDGVVDQFDRVWQGNPSVPEIGYGIGANIMYKNVDFSFLCQGSSSISFYAKPMPFNQSNRGNIQTIFVNDYWSESTQNLNATFPRLGVGNQENNWTNSDHWLKNGSYLRLKQVELGYSLPATWVKSIGIGSVRVYANGLNLLTFSSFDWWDPESKSSTGINYALQKAVNLGVEVKF